MDISELNLRQLRIELKKLGLSPSGLKTELVQRLRGAQSGEIPIPKGKSLSIIEDGTGSSAESDYKEKEKEEEELQKIIRKRIGPKQRTVLLPTSLLYNAQRSNDPELEWNQEREDENIDNLYEDEEEYSVDDFLRKRKSLGLDDKELVKRKKTGKINKHTAIEPPIMTEAQVEFFQIVANYEFQKMKEDKQLEEQIEALREKIQHLKKESDVKDGIIKMLQGIILEKKSVIESLKNPDFVPEELISHWDTVDKYFDSLPPRPLPTDQELLLEESTTQSKPTEMNGNAHALKLMNSTDSGQGKTIDAKSTTDEISSSNDKVRT